MNRQNIVAGKRASRSSRIVREVDSEDDEDEDEEEEAEEVDAMDVDEDEEEDEDVDAEGDEDEDMDAEGDDDDDIEDGTPESRIVVSSKQSVPVKPAINIVRPQDTVEAKEMAMDDDDDDELSDPESFDDEDAEGEDEDAEGEDDDEVGGQPGDMDEDMDSDEDISRGQTPDISKMTKRQRALVEEGLDDGGLMALSNEAQKKKHLTAEENAMRRAEMARRRKNLSEKRNEEEKVCIHAPTHVSHILTHF